jgi:hypothetical protein
VKGDLLYQARSPILPKRRRLYLRVIFSSVPGPAAAADMERCTADIGSNHIEFDASLSFA